MSTTNMAVTTEITEAVAQAASCVGYLYPLTNFIACNSLKSYEEISFNTAMRRAHEMFGARGFLPLSEYRVMYESGRIAPADLNEAFERHQTRPTPQEPNERMHLNLSEMFDTVFNAQIVNTINRQMIKWCGAYLDTTQAQWVPIGKESFFTFWKQLARHDKSLWWHAVMNFSKSIDSLPESSQEAIELHLRELEIQGESIVPYLKRHLIQLPGYASYLNWRENEAFEKGLLTDYLAIRLHYEIVLSKACAARHYKSADLGLVRPLLESETISKTPSKEKSEDDYGPVWQEAYEINYRNKLLSSLSPKPKLPTENENSCCQMVFCIDVRSEPMRRELEQIGPYSTFGFAGFFGMAMRMNELGSAMSLDLCPVLLKPSKNVTETADEEALKRRSSWQALKASALQLKKKVKSNVAGAFGLVELLGLCSALPLAAKTFFPSQSQKILRSVDNKIGGELHTKLELDSFSLQDKVAFAEGTIRGIGLTKFSKVVVLCGHKSSSVNNPFASSLDCGACGGNGGGYSARLAAEILNDTQVRVMLSANDIHIPQDTLFIAAEHDTTTDKITLFDCEDCEELDEDHAVVVKRLIQDLESAGQAVRERRAETLPNCSMSVLNDPMERASDWAQVAPEWGLAGNAAFIAAPRSLSSGTDLNGRVFLHSYDCSIDEENKVLELIMTAPLVVAQWINMQYYLSTVDNDKFGSGSKVVHNVVGDFGVMQGAASDLRLGLPLQSIMTKDGLRHEPMRLLAIIRATRSAIDEVLQKHPEVAKLVSNRWIRLVALEPESAEFYEAFDCGDWHQINPILKDKSEVANASANGGTARY